MTRHLDLALHYKDSGSTGGFTAVASDGTIDRDGEVIAPHAFDPLPTKVPVHLNHGGVLVGSGRPRYEGGRLLLDATFAPTTQAQETRELVRTGHLDRLSVVFLKLKDKVVQGVRTITQGELLAVDLVSIPSNRGTQVLASRGFAAGMTPDDARRFLDSVVKDMVDLELRDARRALARDQGPASRWVENFIKEL